MSRVKNSVATRARRKKVLQMASGARAGRHRLYKSAKETVKRGLTYAYRDRRQKKREYRRLWIVRINAAVRPLGLSYGEFMHGMKLAAIEIDRKVLADIAYADPTGFASLVDKAREALAKAAKAASAAAKATKAAA